MKAAAGRYRDAGKETELHSVILPPGLKRGDKNAPPIVRISGPIRHASLPSVAVVPLLQHAGVPAACVVHVGEAVREGMLLAAPAGPFSAAVHSPVPGVVTAIRRVLLPGGSEAEAIFIRLEGEFDRLGKSWSGAPSTHWTADEGLAHLGAMGVIDAGRSDLPLSLAWRRSRGTRVHHLIVSAIPQDAYQNGEELLITERPDEIASGIAGACRILGPERVSLALIPAEAQGAAADVGESLVSAAGARGIVIERKYIDFRYPAADDARLAREVAGRRIPNGGTIADAGVFVTTPSALLAAANAFDRQLPMIDRTVVVAGGAVKEPAVLRTRIGTRIGELFEECGGFIGTPERIVVGAAMTGSAVHDLGLPVMKTTEAVLALTSKETNGGRRAPCIGCGKCASVCPAGLLPVQLFKLVQHERLEDARRLGLGDCIECGLCSYFCPSHIPLAHGLRAGKRGLQREPKCNAW